MKYEAKKSLKYCKQFEEGIRKDTPGNTPGNFLLSNRQYGR